MSPKEYRSERQKRGTQISVAALLGVHPMTISRRERGEMEIPREAEIALRALPTSADIRKVAR
jgi:transcriptional regulator with XRE-family HTH domain